MKLIVTFEDQDNSYEIPMSKLLKIMGSRLSEEKIKSAVLQYLRDNR